MNRQHLERESPGFIRGGGCQGIVFRPDGDTYRTAFMEVYPPGASFVRGEGATAQECEDSCWVQYQKALNCPSGGAHQFEPRGYRNGAGFCMHCNTFKPNVFTAEELGQYCHACGVATKWHWDTRPDGTVLFSCQEHVPEHARAWFAEGQLMSGRSPLFDALVEAMSARLHRTSDNWSGGQFRPAMSADTTSVHLAAEAILAALPDLLHDRALVGIEFRKLLDLELVTSTDPVWIIDGQCSGECMQLREHPHDTSRLEFRDRYRLTTEPRDI